MSPHDNAATDNRELTITRVFDAPRQLVFEAWIDPQHLVQWSGPEGFTSHQDYFDASPGGAYRVCLRGPDGTEHWIRGIYREVVVNEKLVFTHAWEDETGALSPETLVTITFADQDGGTLLTLRQGVFTTEESRDGHADGWSGSLDRLDRHLSSLAQTD
jgi:uncharacterized protein YndB with AHSA1/START domain